MSYLELFIMYCINLTLVQKQPKVEARNVVETQKGTYGLLI